MYYNMCVLAAAYIVFIDFAKKALYFFFTTSKKIFMSSFVCVCESFHR